MAGKTGLETSPITNPVVEKHKHSTVRVEATVFPASLGVGPRPCGDACSL